MAFKNMFMKKEKSAKEGSRAPARQKKERKHHWLDYHLGNAGIAIESKVISKYVMLAAGIIDVLFAIFYGIRIAFSPDYSLAYLLFALIMSLTLGFALAYLLCWVMLYAFLDLKAYQRRLEVEEVLPDFLQLTASNIKAGMPIDQALWYAVRPKFGVLAKEIEDVAKSTMTGEDLKEALMRFSKKYDSPILKQAVCLLMEGLEAGGEIGDILNNIALNIQESRTLKKEMSANVTSYSIFIGFATLVAAPVLFGLALQLVKVITTITGNIEMPEGVSGPVGLTFSGAGVSIDDFRIFAITSLMITSFFSAAIVSSINKGNVKEGLKYIPMFMIGTLVLFLLASSLLGALFSGMF